MKKILSFLMFVFAVFLLVGCGLEGDKKAGDRATFSTGETIETIYTDIAMKNSGNYKTTSNDFFVIKFKEFVSETAQWYGISKVKAKFFLETKKHIPYNPETIDLDTNKSLEEWSFRLFYFDENNKTKQFVSSENFTLTDARKKEANGIQGYEVEVELWGLKMENYTNPKRPELKKAYDTIYWEIYSTTIYVELECEKGSQLQTKTDWEDANNNPHNFKQFRIIDFSVTLNDDYIDERENIENGYTYKGNKLGYPHDLSQNKTYGKRKKLKD